MRCIIAGSRDITDYGIIMDAVAASGFEITEVVSGRAKGVDTLGEMYATANKLKVATFPVSGADWKQYGRVAGFLRNKNMADYAEALIAIWNGYSTGTKNMIAEAKRKGLKVFIWRTDLKGPQPTHSSLFPEIS